MPGKPALTPRQRASIIADWGAGMPVPAIAVKYHRTAPTIYRMIHPLRTSETPPEMISPTSDWRSRLRQKGVAAVEAGLDCGDDAYRRAEVGVKTLKGLGEFQGEAQTVNMMLSETPREWREAFLLPVLPGPAKQLAGPGKADDAE